MNLNDAFNNSIKWITESEQNLCDLFYVKNNFECFLGHNESGTALKIVRNEYSFISLFINNNEWVFMFNQFQNNTEIIRLIDNFLLGKYYYNCSLSGKLSSVIWFDKNLNQFDLNHTYSDILSIGLNLKDIAVAQGNGSNCTFR